MQKKLCFDIYERAFILIKYKIKNFHNLFFSMRY